MSGQGRNYLRELRERACRAEVDAEDRPVLTSEEHAEIKLLKWENAELRRANEILKAPAWRSRVIGKSPRRQYRPSEIKDQRVHDLGSDSRPKNVAARRRISFACCSKRSHPNRGSPDSCSPPFRAQMTDDQCP